MTQRAQRGSIELPDVGSIPALVELTAGQATAMLLVRPLSALDDVVGTHVGIDVATHRGLLHVDARVAGVRDGELLDLEVAGEGEVTQRRNYARVDAGLEVTVAASSIPTVAVNISGSGVVLSHLDGLASGDLVELSLQLSPSEPPIAISGRVTREGDGQLRAVHFEHVAPVDRERIVQYVFARQRLEAQRTRRA
jgi:hypothetical protein